MAEFYLQPHDAVFLYNIVYLAKYATGLSYG